MQNLDNFSFHSSLWRSWEKLRQHDETCLLDWFTLVIPNVETILRTGNLFFLLNHLFSISDKGKSSSWKNRSFNVKIVVPLLFTMVLLVPEKILLFLNRC
jgi:hypothetical protein